MNPIFSTVNLSYPSSAPCEEPILLPDTSGAHSLVAEILPIDHQRKAFLLEAGKRFFFVPHRDNACVKESIVALPMERAGATRSSEISSGEHHGSSSQ
jgi:hypothetical protein